jgi:hypothetical protein
MKATVSNSPTVSDVPLTAAGRPFKRQGRPTNKQSVCLHCSNPAQTRGLCRACHRTLWRLVQTGRVTEGMLLTLEMIKPQTVAIPKNFNLDDFDRHVNNPAITMLKFAVLEYYQR